jgi:hypothetical protein
MTKFEVYSCCDNMHEGYYCGHYHKHLLCLEILKYIENQMKDLHQKSIENYKKN